MAVEKARVFARPAIEQLNATEKTLLQRAVALRMLDWLDEQGL